MLQQCWKCGLVLLIAILTASNSLFVGAVFGGLTSTLFAYILRLDNKDIRAGLYGYNGILVGLSLSYFLSINIQTYSLILVFSASSTVLMHVLVSKTKIPPYTAPFILSSWGALHFADYLDIQYAVQESKVANNFLEILLLNFSQIFFITSFLSALLIILSLVFCSKRIAICGLVVSFLIAFIGWLLNFSSEIFVQGLIGYSAILTVIALILKFPSRIDLLFIGITLSILITYVFHFIGYWALTAPFVISTWCVIAIANLQNSNSKLVFNLD